VIVDRNTTVIYENHHKPLSWIARQLINMLLIIMKLAA